MQPRKFRLEFWPTLLVLLLFPALLALGRWQLDRVDEKRALIVALSAAAAAAAVDYAPELPRFARVRAQGAWDPRQFLLDAQPRAGRVGYRVLTPLALADGSFLIVDRGWTAASPDRAALPEVAIAASAAQVEGLLDRFPRPGVRTGNAPGGGGAADAPWPRVVLYPTSEALGQALGAPVQPALLRLGPGSAAAPGLELDASVEPMLAAAVGMPPERHLGYAVTWFALAATLVVLWLALAARGRERETREAGR
jgi:surfeit locus 1 family protein